MDAALASSHKSGQGMPAFLALENEKEKKKKKKGKKVNNACRSI
jgi:hypothetical protein